jgi:hypothetical protein
LNQFFRAGEFHQVILQVPGPFEESQPGTPYVIGNQNSEHRGIPLVISFSPLEYSFRKNMQGGFQSAKLNFQSVSAIMAEPGPGFS